MTTTATVICPRCNFNYYTPYGVDRQPHDPMPPALSRADNETYICSECGVEEAMKDFVRERLEQPNEWPIKGVIT